MKLERHLKQRYGELFGAEFDVLLYDLTSTYVEGAAESNSMMRRGYSRDHRSDCEQMVIALIVNSQGFPFSYETFDGNRAEPGSGSRAQCSGDVGGCSKVVCGDPG
jgi:transposase